MTNKIEEGCWAEINGSNTPFDGEVVQVYFAESPDNAGNAIWVISEEFPNSAGFMTDRCYEAFLRRVEEPPRPRELVTDWAEVEYSTMGWNPTKVTTD
jgi:hypothetical protein